jgi:3-deoxy-D-manno-octulosonate 8-phosphate phosphatase (KDO 8-P phosphatase)
MSRSSETLQECLAHVALLATDVDGVLTDGGLYYTEDGQELKRFNVKDGQGLKQVKAAGIHVAIISASQSQATLHRAHKLGIDYVFVGVKDKLACVVELCQNLGIPLEQVAYIGDDLNDLPVLSRVGLPITVKDGIEAAKSLSRYVTSRSGGQGSVREICDLLLGAKLHHE